jgi:sugar/nucleoside kinase (ribokinase family)
MRQIITNGRAHSVIATAGGDGACLLERNSDSVRQFPAAQPQTPAVDSNGAGAAFAAAFLSGYLRGEPAGTCMRYGAITGAHACTVPSAVTNPIDTEELQRAAKSRDLWPPVERERSQPEPPRMTNGLPEGGYERIR